MRPRDANPPRTLRRLVLLAAIALLGALAAAGPAAASPTSCTVNWTGASGDGQWSTAGNWDTGNVPSSGDIVCINVGADATSSPVTVALSSSPTVAGLELGDATLATSGSQTLTVSGELDLENATPGQSGTPDVLGAGLTLAAQGTTGVDPDLDVCLAGSAQLQNSGTLTLGNATDLGSGSGCPVSGGSVTNTGTIAVPGSGQATVDSLTSAQGSTLQGAGTLTVDAGLAFPSGGSGQVDLAGSLILQDDAPTSLGADVQLCQSPDTTIDIGAPQGADPTVTLASGAELGASDGSDTCDGGSGGGQISNAGAITTSGNTEIAPATFDNDGTVTVGGPSGSELKIPADSSATGQDDGAYDITTGTTLAFSSGARDIAATFTGGGSLNLLQNAYVDFTGDANLRTLSSFSVTAGATAEVDDSLETPASTSVWGDLDGYGQVTVEPGTTLTLFGSVADLGEAIYVLNDGTVTTAAGSAACIDSQAVVENAGTLTLGANSTLGQVAPSSECGPGQLLNDSGATLTSTGGTINAEFDNDGTVTVNSGTLNIDGSNTASDTGSYAVNGSAVLSFQDGASQVLGGAISGTGKLQINDTGNPGTSLEVLPAASGSIGSLAVGSGATLQLDADDQTPSAGPTATAPLTVSGKATFAAGSTVQFNGDELSSASYGRTLELLSYASESGSPLHPPDDNGWPATIGQTAVTAAITEPAPSNLTLPSISGNPSVGDQLTLTPGSWSPSPTSVTEQWQDCDPASGDCVNITGATGTSYVPTSNDVGEQIQVVETAADAGGTSSATSMMTTAVSGGSTGVGNTGGGASSGGGTGPSGVNPNPLAPQNLVAPDFNGDEGTVGETLTEIPGQWSGNPTSVTLQWDDCDIAGFGCTPIAGATGPTYKTTENDANDAIVVIETATNANGSTEAESEPSSMVLDLGDLTGGGDEGGGNGSGGGKGNGSSGGSSGPNGSASVSLASHAVSGTGLAVALRCPHRISCPVTLILSATEAATGSAHGHSRATHRGRRRSRIVVVGSQVLTLRAGDHRTVTVKLNHAGRKLLAGDHTLRTVLTATSHSRTLATTHVTFTETSSVPSAHHRTHRRHGHRH